MSPRIAILLDENTSEGGTRYELGKNYVEAIARAGGQPFGLFFTPAQLKSAAREFDGLLCPGGRFTYPDDFYAQDLVSNSPPSDRFETERQLVEDFLALDKPVLGMCAGMQLLACVRGAKMTPDLVKTEQVARHDGPEIRHPIDIVPDTKLAAITSLESLDVNSFHREALVWCPDEVVISARAPDGIIEAIELRDYKFAIGLQWHQEKFQAEIHPGNAIFDAFIAACTRA
ncbi:gamma-glutamyl-gamma-aminobutyrate hydrolase family protein [Maritalea mediterranea]|uniref:Gamma-glutamyl-gamma-aminobutyrate hydrolase family protein n=1 Tax=Maritalea mediterranea TaxID=2909667 RepID=A0ABS9E8T6_9HYPH|nr:gamma-glutamyl-gamma-aminobutyrate hydrolase family protein [Maritalea mediterranea]MCF4099208.1 gamma-glutamyl-gamma-aminobutyrate hydrolase family protein [Maritalea mediterranea]